jgi:hypothetical protein
VNAPVRSLVVIFMTAALGIPGFASGPDSPPSAAALAGLSPEQVLDLANQWGMKAEENGLSAWTTSRAFNFVFGDGSKTVIAMPEDRMPVSIAPYIMKTHPCSAHYPTSCRGELANTPVHVTAVTTDGRKLLDARMTTLPNGFIDLWLPRGLEIDVTMEARGLQVTQRIGTSDTDPTCITTAKLHY